MGGGDKIAAGERAVILDINDFTLSQASVSPNDLPVTFVTIISTSFIVLSIGFKTYFSHKFKGLIPKSGTPSGGKSMLIEG